MSQGSTWEPPLANGTVNFSVLLSRRAVLDRDTLLSAIVKAFAVTTNDDGSGARLRRINFVLEDQIQTFGRFTAEHLDYHAILEGDVVNTGRIDDIGKLIAAFCASIDPGSNWLDLSRTRILITESCSTAQTELAGCASTPGDAKPIKMIAHVHRRADLSAQEFRRHYEEIHAPLAVRHRKSLLCGYRRNYIMASFRHSPSAHHFSNGDVDIPDALSEFHFADATAFAGMQNVDPVLGPMIQQDERVLFDIEKVRVFVVDELQL